MDVSAELRARLHPTAPSPDDARQRPVAGIEHEFVVHGDAGPVDFRQLLPRLAIDGRRLDPADPLAVRGRWGGVITADGREAEIATPPVAVAPGFSAELADWVGAGTATLRRAVGSSHRLEGYSTHLSVQVDDRHVVRAARRFTAHFALPQMLLLDRRSSPGLLVRPRRGRLELCGEYVAGAQRQAAAVFAVAATAAAASGRRPGRRLPPPVRPRTEPARGRYGIYVDRRAYANGLDLYLHGRSMPVARGVDAADVLRRSWDHVRPFAECAAADHEVALVDAVVDGRAPLPIEHAIDDLDADLAFDGVGSTLREAATGAVVRTRRRAGLRIEAVVATWDGTVLAVAEEASAAGVGAPAFVTVPRHALVGFLVALDSGRLDDVLRRAVAAAPTLPLLLSADQLDDVGVYGGVGRIDDLVPGERDPRTGRIGGSGVGGGASRRNKDRRDEPKAQRRIPRWVIAAAAFFGALALLATIAAAVNHDPKDERVVAGGAPAATTLPPAGPTDGWSGTVSIVDHHVEPVMGSDATTQPFTLGTDTGGFTFVATFDGRLDPSGLTAGTATASFHEYFDHDGYFCYGNRYGAEGSGSGPVLLGFVNGDDYPFSVTGLQVSQHAVSVGNTSPGCDRDETTPGTSVGGTTAAASMLGGAGPEQPVDEPAGVRSGARTYVEESDDTLLTPAGDGSGTYTSTPVRWRRVIVVTWHLTKLADRDHDGIPDTTDKCPTTPAPATTSDGCVPSDADRDGIPDAADRCPGTPPPAAIDENGCPTDEPPLPKA